MVSKNLAFLLGLTLSGCSFVDSSEPDPLDYAPSAHAQIFLPTNNFDGKKVLLTYQSNNGPGSSYPLRPIDSELVQGVQKELNARKAYVLPVGNPTGNYMDLNSLFNSGFGSVPDFAVIADRNPNLSGINEKYLGDHDGPFPSKSLSRRSSLSAQ